MNYALIENGTVSNIIVIHEENASEYLSAVPLGDAPVQIGDTYTEGRFYHDGEPLLSPLEAADQTIADLDAEVVDLTYQNILLELAL